MDDYCFDSEVINSVKEIIYQIYKNDWYYPYYEESCKSEGIEPVYPDIKDIVYRYGISNSTSYKIIDVIDEIKDTRSITAPVPDKIIDIIKREYEKYRKNIHALFAVIDSIIYENSRLYFDADNYEILTSERIVDGFDDESEPYLTFAPTITYYSENIWNPKKALIERILRLHKKIYPDILKLGLACNEEETVVSSFAQGIDDKKDSFVFIRYGKTPEELVHLKKRGFDFDKHACIRYGLVGGKGFEIGIFFGRKNDYDRLNLPHNIRHKHDEIIREIEKLKGCGMTWVISDTEPFRLDNHSPEELLSWLTEHNKKGNKSCLSYTYDIYDERLYKENIANEVLEKVTLLSGLYNAFVR